MKQLSFNDDLEALFENIQLGEEPDDSVTTYFLPKLTEQELELVEREDEDFLRTFRDFYDLDVNQLKHQQAVMAASKSKLTYVFGDGWRRTFTIKNSLKRKFSGSPSSQ